MPLMCAGFRLRIDRSPRLKPFLRNSSSWISIAFAHSISSFLSLNASASDGVVRYYFGQYVLPDLLRDASVFTFFVGSIGAEMFLHFRHQDPCETRSGDLSSLVH